jgi:hypothetical protein
VQRYQAPPAADPTGNAGHTAEPPEELLGNYAILARRPQTLMGKLRALARARATAELLGTTQLGDTDCRPFKGRVLWWSCGSYVPEQAPQGAMDCGLRLSR